MKQSLKHPFNPIYDKNSKVLILGSFPSIKSRESKFPYSHPQNKFWKLLSIIFDEEIIDQKEFVLKKNIALWDVIASCEIVGSSDASIKNVKVNDIKKIVDASRIKHIFNTGKKSYDLYCKYLEKKVGIKSICLPSPSPANASIKLDDLILAYKEIKEKLEK